MAGERKRVWGELAAWHMAELIRRVGGEVIDVAGTNPYREPDPPEVEAVKAKEDKRQFWAKLRFGLGLGNGE